MLQAVGPARVRIAIVGAGVAGAFSAYFLRERLGLAAEITVLEREPRVGGRVAELGIAGTRIETGATLIHTANRHMVGAVERLGLHAASGSRRSGVPARRLAIWNGASFDLHVAGGTLALALRALWRYGASLLRARRLTVDMVRKLDSIYGEQAQGASFETPEAMFRRLGLYELTQVDADTYFRRHGVSLRFVREFSDGVARANYNQATGMNAFVTLVSLAGGGLGGGRLVSVAEGNVRVVEGLLSASRARVRTGVEVRRVAAERASGTGYRVVTADGGEDVFDVVIVAAPLEFAALEVSGVDLPAAAHVRRTYCVTHTTIVAGRLRPAFFGIPERDDPSPYLVLTRNHPAIPFSALGWIGRAADGRQDVYKLFSRDTLDDELLDRLFSWRTETVRLAWRAYPMLEPTSVWPPFRLSHGLYYVNAMESAVSTMETEAIAACNVANLAASELAQAGLAPAVGGGPRVA
ncbi:MAG: FAD-dependent oxidoreductase [Firmicutes bacterium]|nr:FAD-dependent oxidoreductase [Bacillota bacterium]